MNIETTQTITRDEAIQMITEQLAKKIAALCDMTDAELENLLYSLTRDTNHHFDDFSIKDNK